MCKYLNVLNAYALQEAHAIKIDDGASDDKFKEAYQLASAYEATYKRAKQSDQDNEICPKCWVRHGSESKLFIAAFSNVSDVNIYECENCDFNYIFPRK